MMILPSPDPGVARLCRRPAPNLIVGGFNAAQCASRSITLAISLSLSPSLSDTEGTRNGALPTTPVSAQTPNP